MYKGLICQSLLRFATPVVLVNSADGGLWICIHYGDINSKRIKKWYPLPLICETLNLLRETKLYTKLDIQGIFHLL